ncbi:MAG: NAD+ synthase [Frankiaceae bacterium]|nr:NAD+ synthase [Frankiaceae bacterium]
MAQLRLALAQIDPVVGDLEGNADQVVERSRQAAGRGAHLVAFPEMALTGYPVEDLALRGSFVDASRQAMEHLAERLAAEGLGDLVVVVGFLDGAPDAVPVLGTPKGAPQNAAAIVHRGRIAGRYAKHHLPNYGVFDEYRYFVPGSSLTVARVHGVDVAVAICEDIWQEGGPVAVSREAGAGLLLVINGSPYERNKDDTRLDLVRRRAAGAGCTLAYVNMVGGQDELVFDGDSLVVDADGGLLARARQFATELLVVDLDLPDATAPVTDAPSHVEAPDGTATTIERVVLSAEALPRWAPEVATVAERIVDEAEVYSALVLALRDYVAKNGFSTVVLGLSGGIDSALTAAIACDAIGAAHVHGVSMPSSYSSEHSRSDAADLAERTGLVFQTVPIAPMVESFLGSLALTGLAEENLQARVRGVTLMGLSNEHGHLVLAPGNKSELAVGYSTIYGDAVGGFAPIKDLPKTWVWRLARWRNADAEARGEKAPIPEASISKEPSAELRPGQLDTDSLPPYDVLDDILDDYVEQDRGSGELLAAGFDQELVEKVLRLVDRAEYKRRQYPPGPKISFKAFGRDRRLPITNRWREHAPHP